MFIDREQKLYMLLLGCKPKGRLIEQHDVFFGLAPSLKLLIPDIKKFWPQGRSNLHIDAWREVCVIDGYKINVCSGVATEPQHLNLFFINLGGYEKGNFDELHHKMLVVAATLEEASKKAKAALFYKSAGFKGAASHIDNKYDVDDIITINDLFSGRFYLNFEKINEFKEDEIHLGYFKLDSFEDQD